MLSKVVLLHPYAIWGSLTSSTVLPEVVLLHPYAIRGSSHTCQLFLFWRNSSSFRSKKENDFIMCSCFCSNLCIVMYRKFRNVPLFKFFSLICSSFWNLKVGKYELYFIHSAIWGSFTSSMVLSKVILLHPYAIRGSFYFIHSATWGSFTSSIVLSKVVLLHPYAIRGSSTSFTVLSEVVLLHPLCCQR